MTRVLAVWEDDSWKPLGHIVKRLVRITAPASDAEIPAVLGHTTQGNGNFERYAHITWPAVRPRGLPADPGMIDHLVCIVDGDRLRDLLPQKVAQPPTEASAIAAWHAAAERTW